MLLKQSNGTWKNEVHMFVPVAPPVRKKRRSKPRGSRGRARPRAFSGRASMKFVYGPCARQPLVEGGSSTIVIIVHLLRFRGVSARGLARVVRTGLGSHFR